MLQVLWRIPIKTGWFPDGIPIYGFGAMLFVAFLLCSWLAGRRSEREGLAKEHMQDLGIWMFIGGLLGARVLFLILEARVNFWEFWVQLPRIWDGGIILYGSIVGALLAYVLAYRVFFHRYKQPFLKVADILAPSLALGIGLGRIGCFLNGCCYGMVACPECAVVPVSFPLSAPARLDLVEKGYQTAAGFTFHNPEEGKGVPGARVGRVEPGSAADAAGLKPGDVIVRADGEEIVSPEKLSECLHPRYLRRGEWTLALEVVPADAPAQAPHRLAFVPWTLGLYPTQLYETVSMVLLFFLLTAYYPLRRRDGQVVAILMLGYGVHRFFNEQLRSDLRPVGFESYVSLILVAGGAVLWLWLQGRPPQYKHSWAVESVDREKLEGTGLRQKGGIQGQPTA